MVTPDSILGRNRYVDIKIVFAEHSCFQPDRDLACFHYPRGSVTPVTGFWNWPCISSASPKV